MSFLIVMNCALVVCKINPCTFRSSSSKIKNEHHDNYGANRFRPVFYAHFLKDKMPLILSIRRNIYNLFCQVFYPLLTVNL